ncbi:hypothetical protein [Pseudarthrobacter sp. 1C304]|uniref:hypothetical protein n=1 Tax=Pseudarthrobacter sp. 1C304 TaxID=3457438 RepID=UPI003FCEFF4B
MHYDAAGDAGWLAALATSKDGETWAKHGPVLSLGAEGSTDSGSASYGTTYFDGAKWHMFYLGTPNVSQDGLRTPSFPYQTMKAEAPSPYGPWRKRPDIVPFIAKPDSWYDDTASPGQVVRTDDGYIMLFSAATTVDGSIQRTLGIARTKDLDSTWTVDPEPALPLEEQIENSSLHFEAATKTWFLFTNHIGRADDVTPVPPQLTGEYTDAVWVYWTTDVTKWDPAKRAVVIDAKSAGWSPRVIGLPSVVVNGNRLAVYYDGAVADDISHGHRDVAVTYIDLPLADGS